MFNRKSGIKTNLQHILPVLRKPDMPQFNIRLIFSKQRLYRLKYFFIPSCVVGVKLFENQQYAKYALFVLFFQFGKVGGTTY